PIRASFSRTDNHITSPTMKPETSMSPPNIKYAISVTRVLIGHVARVPPKGLQVRDHRVELGLALERLRRALDHVVGIRRAERAQRAQTAPRLCGRARFGLRRDPRRPDG